MLLILLLITIFKIICAFRLVFPILVDMTLILLSNCNSIGLKTIFWIQSWQITGFLQSILKIILRENVV